MCAQVGKQSIQGSVCEHSVGHAGSSDTSSPGTARLAGDSPCTCGTTPHSSGGTDTTVWPTEALWTPPTAIPQPSCALGGALCSHAPHKSVGTGAITSLPFPWPNATSLDLGDLKGCWSSIHTTDFHTPWSFTCAFQRSASVLAELYSQVNKAVLDVIYSCIYFCPSMNYKCKSEFLKNKYPQSGKLILTCEKFLIILLLPSDHSKKIGNQ